MMWDALDRGIAEMEPYAFPPHTVIPETAAIIESWRLAVGDEEWNYEALAATLIAMWRAFDREQVVRPPIATEEKHKESGNAATS